jgi:hypothetical protein
MMFSADSMPIWQMCAFTKTSLPTSASQYVRDACSVDALLHLDFSTAPGMNPCARARTFLPISGVFTATA